MRVKLLGTFALIALGVGLHRWRAPAVDRAPSVMADPGGTLNHRLTVTSEMAEFLENDRVGRSLASVPAAAPELDWETYAAERGLEDAAREIAAWVPSSPAGHTLLRVIVLETRGSAAEEHDRDVYQNLSRSFRSKPDDAWEAISGALDAVPTDQKAVRETLLQLIPKTFENQETVPQGVLDFLHRASQDAEDPRLSVRALESLLSLEKNPERRVRIARSIADSHPDAEVRDIASGLAEVHGR